MSSETNTFDLVAQVEEANGDFADAKYRHESAFAAAQEALEHANKTRTAMKTLLAARNRAIDTAISSLKKLKGEK